MAPISRIANILSCGVMLCLSLSQAAQAESANSASDKKLEVDQPDPGQGVGEKLMGEEMKAANTVKGEVLRVEGANYFVKKKDGKEVRLHTDSTTLMMTGIIGKGDRIEAKVNAEGHALSMSKAQRP
jgi:hypothetical protein